MGRKEQQTAKKMCRKCGIEKPLVEFYDHTVSRDRKHSWCTACCRENAAIKYKARRVAKPRYTSLLAELADLRAQVQNLTQHQQTSGVSA